MSTTEYEEMSEAEERAAVEAVEAENELYEFIAGIADGALMRPSYLRLNKRRWPTAIADAVRDGHAPPPTMLGESWLVQGELHWVAAEAEAAKTWLALWWAKRLIESDPAR